MRAGELDRRVQLQTREETDDEAGEPVVTWTDFAQVWAAVEPQSGSEFVTEAQPHAVGTVRIRIRYLAGVQEKMRAVYDGVPYDIKSVRNIDEQRKEMYLIATKGMSDG